MRPKAEPRAVAVLLGAVLALLGAVVAPLFTTPTAASASTVGGTIARSEIMARAQNWVDRGLRYDMDGSWASDLEGSHTYRRDCSGLVSMAWHLGSSLTTDRFLAKARNGDGMEVIPKDGLKAGDAMVYDNDGGGTGGHIELFSHWVNSANHNDGAYVYSFNSDGQTVQNPYANNNVGKLGKNSNDEMNQFTFIRYKAVDGERVSDFSGDGYSDVLGVNAAGDLMYYPNNGIAISDSTARRLATGWGSYSHVMAADFSGDGAADILGVNSSGNLLYFPNNGFNISGSVQLKSGFGTFLHVAAGDFSGDGYADILGVNAAGDLMYYPNNGIAISDSTARRLATGWGTIKHLMAADFSGDGAADILAVDAAGNLMYYPNNGFNIAGAAQLKTGFGTYLHVFASDFSGDDHADILGVDASGNVQYFPNNGLAIAGSVQLDTGWGSFTHAE
jgi:FG-GAP-like repeat